MRGSQCPLAENLKSRCRLSVWEDKNLAAKGLCSMDGGPSDHDRGYQLPPGIDADVLNEAPDASGGADNV